MFTFNSNIPAAANNPSNDQPVMLANNVSNAGIWDVDHIGFNADEGGTHLQVTLSSKNTPSSPTDPESVVYTANGTSSPVAQLFYINQNATFHASAMRAWGYANTAGIIASQSVNITSVVRNFAGQYTITMPANVVSSSNYAVFVSATTSASVGALLWSYTISTATSFILQFRSLQNLPTQTLTDPISFSFQVLQI
jgi:hypothetical protein